MKIWVAGYPGAIGGANTECWHTVKLWRKFGLQVSMIPLWGAPAPTWRQRLYDIGVDTYCFDTPEALLSSPPTGLRNGIVVSFCNSTFLRARYCWERLQCKTVWVSCMTTLFPVEHFCFANGRAGLFDAHVFQSEHQYKSLLPFLREYGPIEQRAHIIRGAIDLSEFPFSPRSRNAGEPFVVGRLSRAAKEKFKLRLWQWYDLIPDPKIVRVMGWSSAIQALVGAPPKYAECLPAGAQSALQFVRELHCLSPLNANGVTENWPRVGLEAMAVGVPVVAENEGGWREQIVHGETGYLFRGREEYAEIMRELSRNEGLRLSVAKRARAALTELVNAAHIVDQWRALFGALISR